MAGVTQPTVSRWLKGSTPEPKQQETLEAIIDATDNIVNFRPAAAVNSRDLPVYSAVEGGKGEMVVSTDPIETVVRPWYLKDVKEGYAVYVTGESMEPRYFAGEIAVVNPKAPLVRGRDVIVTTAREGGDFRAILKVYMGATPDSWKLRQYNPPSGDKQDFSVSKKDWPFVLRVVGKHDGT